MKRILVGGCVALLVTAACSDDPSLYLGGPAGPTARIQLSSADVKVTVGDSVRVGGAALDAVGNVTGDVPSFTSCTGTPVTLASATADGLFTAATWVRATELGVGCVVASAGGVVDTFPVQTGPAGLAIVGPDTIVSGLSGTFTAVATALNGSALTGTTNYAWTSSGNAFLVTELAEGAATARSPGAPSILLRAPNGVSARRPVTIVPDVLLGTISQTSGSAGEVVSFARTGGDAYDLNTQVRLGTVLGFIDRITADSIYVAMPASGVAGAQNLTIENVGPNELAQRLQYTANSAFGDTYEPGSSAPATAPSYMANRTTPHFGGITGAPGGNWIYFTHSGFGTGSASRGILNGGTKQDHYFAFTSGPSGGTITEARLEWTNGGSGGGLSAADHDLLICRADDVTFSDCPGEGFSGNSANEVITNVALEPDTDYFVVMTAWLSRNNIHNFRLRLTGTGFN